MADDVMIFPDTWEEFEKQYGFYDIKRAYTYGNTRLIPSFRVQQWLDHIDDIKRKKQSQKNKMEQIAAMFGKKLGEHFRVKNEPYNDYVFTEEGLYVVNTSNVWVPTQEPRTLHDLLTGNAEVED